MNDLAQLQKTLRDSFDPDAERQEIRQAPPLSSPMEPAPAEPLPAGEVDIRDRRLIPALGMIATALAFGYGHRDVFFMIAGALINVASFLIVTHVLDRRRRRLPRVKSAAEIAEEARRRAEEASAAKSRLLATVAHDIRTPLTGLLGMADLLENSRLAADQRNYVSGIRQAGQVLSYLVEDLLDFATLETGRFEVRRVAQSPRKMIEGIVEMLAPRAHFKGLEIASFISPDVPEYLDLDNGRLRQVLFNVVGNAVKFTRRGGVSVFASMDGSTLVIDVIDTGPGMTEADQSRIFQEFVQVGPIEGRAGGKGLGLSISMRIIQAFGGKISVKSAIGEGSTFNIRIPVSAETLTSDRRGRAGAVTGSVVLLLAPDGPAAQAIAKTISALGGVCRASADLAQAAEILAAGRIDGRFITDVIIDHRLESGYVRDLARRVEKMKLRSVFLVNPEERQARITGPYDAWLIRPLREQSLIDVMRGKLRGLERRGATNDNLPHELAAAPGMDVPARYVLLGEDDPVNILLARTTLEKAGHRVVSSTDFIGLAERVAGPPGTLPSLIVTDINMPGGDICGLLDTLSQNPATAAIPVLVLTGEQNSDLILDVLEKGARRVLSKPILPQDLIRHVDDLISPAAGGSMTIS